MRVLIVNPAWNPRVTDPSATLAAFPTLTGWAGAVRSAGADAVTVYQRFPSNAQVTLNDVRYEFGDDRALASAIRRAAPDLVHFNGIVFPRFVRKVRKALASSTALVAQDHGGVDPHALSSFGRLRLRYGLAAADALLVSSDGQAEDFYTAGLSRRESRILAVMESSTTIRPVPSDVARRDTGMSGAPALLWVGRLNDNKDPLTVLAGVTGWFAEHPSATLTMVFQGGDLEVDVRAIVAASPRLAERVRLVGAVAHEGIANFYSSADAFVLGSHHEGSGYAVIEAMACGVWPVVTDIAPFAALTDRGAVGSLWRVGDALSLRLALTDALTRSTRAEVRRRFERAFSWPAIGTRAVDIYASVIAERRANAGEERPRTRS